MTGPEPLAPLAAYDAEIVAARESVLVSIATLDAADAVPACPRWTVVALVEHLARVHRWAVAVVGGAGPSVEPPARPPGADLATWYADASDDLLLALRSAPAERSCWTFFGPGTVAFWFRRQAHETALHASDLRTAAGHPPTYPLVLADDGVEEVLGSMLPGQHERMPVGLDRPVALVATDTGSAWLLESAAGEGPPPWRRTRGAEGASVTASATASDLALGLWHRIDPAERWQVDGDRPVLDALLAQRLTP